MKELVIAMAAFLACAPLAAFSQDDVIAHARDASVTQSDVTTLLKGVDRRARQAADPAALDRLVRAALAKANSQDRTSAANGGDMGFLPEGLLLPAARYASAVAGSSEYPAESRIAELIGCCCKPTSQKINSPT